MICHVPTHCPNFISTQQQGNVLIHAKRMIQYCITAL